MLPKFRFRVSRHFAKFEKIFAKHESKIFRKLRKQNCSQPSYLTPTTEGQSHEKVYKLELGGKSIDPDSRYSIDWRESAGYSIDSHSDPVATYGVNPPFFLCRDIYNTMTNNNDKQHKYNTTHYYIHNNF